MKNKIDPLLEWAFWAHLDSKTDLELILLKGHLLLEMILGIVLTRNNIKDCEDYSFHRKIVIFEKKEFEDCKKKDIMVSSLMGINKLRNKLAHDFHFEIKNGEFELWSINILKNLGKTKYTKFTLRTKIVHSFSIISKNILECT